MTVVLALVGMLLAPLNIFRSVGLGPIVVVVIAVLAALTLLPTVLSLLGPRVNSLLAGAESAHHPHSLVELYSSHSRDPRWV